MNVQPLVPAEMILRERNPLNLEFPFSTLDGPITPDARFYVRNHFPEPPVREAHQWKLKIEGAVSRPFELSYDALVTMPTHTLTATMECAGNGRAFLAPKQEGVQWELGAVGTATWTGVRLADVLNRARIRDGAVEVVLEGADKGEIKEKLSSPGEIHFARSVPLQKALAGDVLLAFQMNGEPLPHAHGHPVRAIVPGWYGMASVKWLERIVVTRASFTGYFQTADYSYWESRDGLPIQMTPITEMQVKAEIARPAAHEFIQAGTIYHMRGAAWAGESDVAQVEISTDSGSVWRQARLLGPTVRYTWCLWEYEWHVPERAGNHTLMARASDVIGCAQPFEHAKARGRYLITHVLPIPVEVRDSNH